jgi:nucleoid DNA-binding protein
VIDGFSCHIFIKKRAIKKKATKMKATKMKATRMKTIRMKTIRMKDIIAEIAYVMGQTQIRTQETLRLLLENIGAELGKGNRVEFRDFGVFEVLYMRARKGYSPQKQQYVMLPASNRVRFRAGRGLKQRIQVLLKGPLKESLEAPLEAPLEEPLEE